MAVPKPPRHGAPTEELREFTRRFVQLGVAIVSLVVLGTAGMALTAGYDVWHSFLRTLDIIATTGAYEPSRDAGAEVIRVLLTILGVGTLFYALVTVTEFFVAGHVAELLAARRMQREMDGLSDHYIICGFGRVGRQVARDLRAAGARYVIVDEDPANREHARDVGVRFITGDASDDATLLQAGIERARAVVACADSDAQNVFITLTAKQLNPALAIIARAAAEEAERKLLRAGASRVISPYKASGAEMARLALHPQVSGVLDVDAEYRMEEIEVTAGCAGAGQRIGDIRGGAYVVGLRRAAGGFQPQPPSETVLEPGDVIMAMGTPRTMDRLEALFAPSATGARAS
ncbi:MAG: TrkA family potassium uptake protein [Solirubrobacterales bacterium]|nr:TrkA family potassium uptake protein [Solirubrobacterales bacterium]